MVRSTKKMRESDWLARLVLTSSEAEMLGSQLLDLQGYSELVDQLEEPVGAEHCQLHCDCTYFIDPLATMQCGPDMDETDQRDAG